jgi:general secretion pathway protein F
MVRAGEAAGSLNIVLKEMAVQLEADARLRSYLASALTYPFILLIVSILSVLMLLTFVVPQFRGIFDSMGDALPLSTKIVIDFSDFVRIYWIQLLISFLVIAVIFNRWRSTPDGRRVWDGAILGVPLLGGVVKNLQFAIYFRTLGMLLQRGVSLADSLGIAVDTVTNAMLRTEVEPVVSTIKKGKRLSDAFSVSQFGQAGVAQLIRVAEETGQLESTLLGLGERFEDEGRRTMTRVLSTIEPIIIICLGAVVAFIIIAILGGVLSINDTI